MVPDNNVLSGRRAEAAKMLDTSIDSLWCLRVAMQHFIGRLPHCQSWRLIKGACHFVALKTSFGPGTVMDSRKVPLRCFKNR